MKPKHNRIFCIGCHHGKMWFESQAKADNFLKFNKESIAAGRAKCRHAVTIVLSAAVGT